MHGDHKIRPRMGVMSKGDTLDEYQGADGERHRRFRMGPGDDTATVVRYPASKQTRRYHPRCYGCWNGNAHSEAFHDANAIGDW